MFKIYTFFFGLLIISQLFGQQTNIKQSIIVKTKVPIDKNTNQLQIELNNSIENEKGTISKLFPLKQWNANKSKNEVDLSTIYKIDLPTGTKIDKIIKHIQSLANVIYAEPMVIPKLCYFPSDTFLTKQYQLSIIDAFRAWDIEKGDSNIVIGITDTGIDIDHPDLINSIAYNYADPINGIDDDGDGYIDNYRGWDTGDNDNDPSTFSSNHGNNVSGLAGATTDNITGIAGTGFKCRILPIKIDADANGSLVGAYQGIVYAADHGADIINCSWGSYSYSNLGNDIINYATSKGSLVVAAVGNDGKDLKFYPAAYPNALAVGMTDSLDLVRSNSNYGHYLDLLAVGQGMWTTANNAQYNYNGGTSMACPLVSGAAAIVKAHYPSFSPMQIAERLRNTADDIEYKQDKKYHEKMGGGRLNMYRSVSDSLNHGVRSTLKSIGDGNDSTFLPGDTLRLIFDFTNYLSPGNNFIASLSSPDQAIRIIKGNYTIGSLATLESKNNQQQPFLAIITNRATTNQKIDFRLQINEDNYQRVSWYETNVNVDYINISNSKIATSITSIGRIGYNDYTANEGLGFSYKNQASALYEGSFMVGLNSQTVLDGFRGEGSSTDKDFISLESVKQLPHAIHADIEANGIFSDNTDSIITIQHKSYLYRSALQSNFLIQAYKIIAKKPIHQAYAGIIIDWDIMDYSKNKSNYDAARNLSYSYSTQNKSPYYGIQLLNPTNAIPFAIDNVADSTNIVNLSDGFSTAEKYTVMSTTNTSAGNVGNNGNDIIQALSFGPFSLDKDSSIVVAFSIIAADSLNDLQAKADIAKNTYFSDSLAYFDVQKTSSNYTFKSKVYPNPAHHSFTLEVTTNSYSPIEYTLYSPLGEKIFSKTNMGYPGVNYYTLDNDIISEGIYFLSIRAEGKDKLHKIVLLK